MKRFQTALLLVVVTLTILGASGCTPNCEYDVRNCPMCTHVISYLDSRGGAKTATTLPTPGGVHFIISDCQRVTFDSVLDDGFCCAGLIARVEPQK